jgi:microcystin-dependent protein
MDEIMAMIKLFAGNYCPQYYMLCDGRELPVNQHQALYSILGNMYGGQGMTTFALPDLRPEDTTYEIVMIDEKPTIQISKVKRNWHENEPKYIICVEGIYPPRY